MCEPNKQLSGGLMYRHLESTSILVLALSLFSGCAHRTNVASSPQIMIAPADASNCPSGIDAQATQPLSVPSSPTDGSCVARTSHGLPIPDPTCTPGAINPTLTIAIIDDPHFRTACVRNQLTSEDQKKDTYAWYSVARPISNTGQEQVCELDHLIPLYFGGADDLANIWPQCGPDATTLNNRYFKQKDRVELYLGKMVRAGKISLGDAQRGIASDWTQYITAANAYCARSGCQNPEGVEAVE
jgi:hypothetical protein